MITGFQLLSALTVPSDYSWDKGVPFSSNDTTKSILDPIEGSITVSNDVSEINGQDSFNTVILTDSANTVTTYISGYAPGVKIVLQNTSVPNPDFFNTNYEWDFGDYYNNVGTYTLSCLSTIEHTYVMPGTYTVKLKLKQIRVTSELINEDPTCRGLYDTQWLWDQVRLSSDSNFTWDQLTCSVPVSAPFKLEKWWVNELNCLEKYCYFWMWGQLACQNYVSTPGDNPVTWEQAAISGPYAKKWEKEDNETPCTVFAAKYLETVQPIEQEFIIQKYVEVKELLPVAGLQSITQPVSGDTPLTVQLSPKTTKPGSFPIDRIDWDFGDGSPILTVSRYSTPPNNTVFTNTFSSDPIDTRNYDVIHTYIREKNVYPVFYPSLTCYSANTNSSDSCCITIGPVGFSNENTDINLIKTKNTNDGNLYVFDVNNNIVFNTNNATSLSSTPITYPSTKIRNNYNVSVLYTGNPGTNYPPPYIPQCP